MVNELQIDDGLFSYGSRSTKFINYMLAREGFAGNGYPGPFEKEDRLFFFGVEVGNDVKFIKRTRRKFWEDVSARGGQYSALMIVLTGLYALIQGPF